MAAGIFTGLSVYRKLLNYSATTNPLVRNVAVHRASVGKKSHGR